MASLTKPYGAYSKPGARRCMASASLKRTLARLLFLATAAFILSLFARYSRNTPSIILTATSTTFNVNDIDFGWQHGNLGKVRGMHEVEDPAPAIRVDEKSYESEHEAGVWSFNLLPRQVKTRALKVAPDTSSYSDKSTSLSRFLDTRLGAGKWGVYVLNMDNRIDRFKVTASRLAAAGFPCVQRFSAVDARLAGYQTIPLSTSPVPLRRGEQGYTESMSLLLQTARSDGYRWVFTFDDDILPHVDTEAQLRRFLSTPKCFDSVGGVYMLGASQWGEPAENKRDLEYIRQSDVCYKPTPFTFGSFAVLYDLDAAADEIINWLDENPLERYDHMWYNLSRWVPVAIVYPNIFIADCTESTIKTSGKDQYQKMETRAVLMGWNLADYDSQYYLIPREVESQKSSNITTVDSEMVQNPLLASITQATSPHHADKTCGTGLASVLRKRTDYRTYDVVNKVTLGIKAFMRQGCVLRLIDTAWMLYPGINIIVVDDSQGPISYPPTPNLTVVQMPYDSGVAAGRNEILKHTKTPYLLMSDDDYLFIEPKDGVYAGTDLSPMLEALENNVADIAGGVRIDSTRAVDVKQHAPGGSMLIDQDAKLLEVGFDEEKSASQLGTVLGAPRCAPVEFVEQFMMMRVSALRDDDGNIDAWDSYLKNNDHFDFFLRQKVRGLRVFGCPTVHVLHEKGAGVCPLPDEYLTFRSRWDQFLPYYMSKWGVQAIVDLNHRKRMHVVLRADGGCQNEHLWFGDDSFRTINTTREGQAHARQVAKKVAVAELPEHVCALYYTK